MTDSHDKFPHVDLTQHPVDMPLSFQPMVWLGEEMDVEAITALAALAAAVAEMGREPVELPDLDMDGRMHDAPDNDRGVTEDAAFETSLDSLSPCD